MAALPDPPVEAVIRRSRRSIRTLPADRETSQSCRAALVQHLNFALKVMRVLAQRLRATNKTFG
jgi:hypothetical protein